MHNKKIFWMIVGIIIFIDQISKYFIRTLLIKPIKIFSWFSLQFTENTGAGFGILKEQTTILIIISILVLTAILYYYKEITKNRTQSIFFALIFAGGLGNLIDRIVLRKVTDFIAIWKLPAFNIADSAITIGAIVLATYLIRQDIKNKTKK